MKKIFMTLSLAAILAIPATSFAQNADNGKKNANTAVCCQTNGKGQCTTQCTPECQGQCPALNGTCTNANDCRKDCKTGRKCKGKKNADIRQKGHKGDRHGNHRHGKKGMSPKSAQNVLFQGITLTDDQQQKMQALREQRRADSKKAKADMAAKKNEERQKRIAAYDKEVEKILTPEQYKQYQANKESMKNKRQGKANF